jgi:hypothetical protein
MAMRVAVSVSSLPSKSTSQLSTALCASSHDRKTPPGGTNLNPGLAPLVAGVIAAKLRSRLAFYSLKGPRGWESVMNVTLIMAQIYKKFWDLLNRRLVAGCTSTGSFPAQ